MSRYLERLALGASSTYEESSDSDEEEKMLSSSKEEIAILEQQKNGPRVWHDENCCSCLALQKISPINMARTQHHFKFGTIFSVYYLTMMALESFSQSQDDPTKPSAEIKHTVLTDPKKAKLLCQKVAASFASNGDLFEMAAAMSDQLVQHREGKFNCDRYEEYLTCLHSIGQLINAEKGLMDDINMYRLPFMQPNTSSSEKSDWDKIHLRLRHSPTREKRYNFGKFIKEMAEDESTFPDYDFECHSLTDN